jgi:hypothetical protein
MILGKEKKREIAKMTKDVAFLLIFVKEHISDSTDASACSGLRRLYKR